MNMRPLWLLVLMSSAWPAEAQSSRSAIQSLPARMLWLWDRPQQSLSLPSDAQTGAAVQVQSFWLTGDQVRITPRRNPLHLPAKVAVVPVFHFDVDPNQPFAGTTKQRQSIVAAIVTWNQHKASTVIQIDFEAKPSARAFLLALLLDLRAALPAATQISMTALASWCFGDRWMANLSANELPVDEIVPMYFRMGRAGSAIMQASLQAVPEPRCRHAYGTASDEADWQGAKLGRQYVFIGRTNFSKANNNGKK